MPVVKKARRVSKPKSVARGGRQALIALAGNPGGSYTTASPKGGTTTRKPSGKADTFEGPGPAPSGTTKVPEKDYTEVPTVTVGPTGSVSTSGFKQEGAAKRAVRAQKASERRVQRIVRSVAQGAEKRSQRAEEIQAPEAYKAPKVEVPSYKRSLPGPTNVKKTVPVAEHTRGNVPPNPAVAKISSVPGRNANLKGTQAERKAARAKVQQTKKALKRSRQPAPLPGLDAEGQHVARQVLKTGKRLGASRKELLAAAETGLVETSGFHNLHGGDADSEGWRQERRSLYPEPTNVRQGAVNFFNEAKTDQGPKATAGQLAQTVQGSAYPERYDERKPEANAIVKAFEKGKASPKAKADYKAAVKEAKELGLKVSPAGKPNVGKAPPKVVKKYKQALTTMKEIDKQGFAYQWGGGHAVAGEPTGGPGTGYDCSGAVSAMLHSVGALNTPLVSGSMGEALEPGPGAITVFYNSVHTFAYIPALGKYWGTSTVNPGGGAGFFPKSVGDAEVASGNSAGSYAVGHVPGLGKKQALQLGAGLGSMTSAGTTGSQPFPGMTLSPSGTSAVVNDGKKQEGIGFSNQPLTPLQKLNRTNRQLKDLGVAPVTASTKAPQTKDKVLKELAAKYGVSV